MKSMERSEEDQILFIWRIVNYVTLKIVTKIEHSQKSEDR